MSERSEPTDVIAEVLAVSVGDIAARILTDELHRHAGPKSGLLVGVTAESAVLGAALDALLPDDTLAVVAAVGTEASVLSQHLQRYGDWVANRVIVLDSVDAADPVDVIVLAEPLRGTAEATRSTLDSLGKRLNPGGVVSVAALAVPGLGGAAAAELAGQAAAHGVGSDLVLRNRPPLRVYRLRYTAAETPVASRMSPAYRTSSVPVTSTMHIDSNGVAAAGIALGVAALLRRARPASKVWLLPALAAVPVAAFFRDPERVVPDDGSAIVAASDGTVLSVQEVSDERFGSTSDYLRIAVFLSVLDVHVNRSPVAGRVVDYFVTNGGYAPAMKPAAEHNVAAYTVFDTERGTVVVAQRTGLIARRIVQRAPVGTLLARGERFGLIRFGSRTDVYLPAGSATPLVASGDTVHGGATTVATWSS